jgi:O-antigen ligase
MPTILAIAALFLLATDALNLELSVLPGLSAKNLLIYFIAVLLALRMVMGRASIMVAGQMQAAFIVQIMYAAITMLLVALILEYPSYNLMDSIIRLKSALIDHFIFFAVFLFGVRSADDAVKVIKGLLLGALFLNALTILDAMGIVNIGFEIREDGRTTGAIGESNQYAAFLVLLLPANIAAAVAAKGVQRLFWLGASGVAAFALVMTASRGGFVGLAMSIAVGAYLYRHLISYSRAMGWVMGAMVLMVLIVALSPYGGLLAERMIGQTGSIDVNDASSGRSEIWSDALAVMYQNPITFITGYGWNAYASMPFYFSPHNHYLSLWFNLGLVGLFCGVYLLFSAIGRARRASAIARPPYRGQLIAFVLGAVGLCTAVFFVDLHKPWYYFWMYGGLVMKLALCVNEQPALAPVSVPRPRLPAKSRDPYGWAQPQQQTQDPA